MGCGGSRLTFTNNSSTVPQNVRPLLQNRFDEIKKKLQIRGCVNPYKKELVNNDVNEEGPSHQPILSSKSSSTSSLDERLSCVTAEGSKMGIGREASFLSINDEGIENIEDDDENERTNFDERMLRRDDFSDCPRSPSFRVYCTEDDQNRKTFDKKNYTEMGLIEEETPSEVEEETQNKVEPKTVKKGSRRSFRKVLPSGGRQIKNLLNVKACTPRGQSRRHNQTEKPNA